MAAHKVAPFLIGLTAAALLSSACAGPATPPTAPSQEVTSARTASRAASAPTAPVPSLPAPVGDLDDARRLYPPDLTRALLDGRIPPAPEGFDDCMAEDIGQERLAALRSGTEPISGQDNDIAALCLLALEVPPESLPQPSSGGLPPGQGGQVEVEFIDSTYLAAPGGTAGFFQTGQEADIMLSGIDFDDAGGGLLFNHQAGVASDGTHLLLADSNNNRVLIWNTLPDGNAAPDLVLGQKNLNTNNPGTGRDQLNWPVSVATDGQRIIVADTYNDRILIWNQFPSESGAPADLVIQGGDPNVGGPVSKSHFFWPWGVWTDGKKLVLSSTHGGAILIWNDFPTQDDQPADLLLTGGGHMGTPRTITSDGHTLIVGDHNARVPGQPSSGTFFWKTFPTTDEQPYDFFMTDPIHHGGSWLQGDFTEDGRLVVLGSTLYIWDNFPESENDTPDLSLTGYALPGGDHAGIAVVGERLYISSGNENKLLVYNTIPTRPDQRPDFAIGSPDIDTNTLETHFIISNPVPASNGESLFVSSDFDSKLYVWRALPDQSGAHPDVVYTLPRAPWDNALWGNILALAGKEGVYIWEQLPLSGQLPDRTLTGRVGSILLQELTGVALDERYFYLADAQANKVYVWEGLPDEGTEPAFSLDVQGPQRLSTDGQYLAVVATFEHALLLYRVGKLPDGEPVQIGGRGQFNLPQGAAVAGGYLFIADTGFNRVHVWSDMEDAWAGLDADVILGSDDYVPQIGRDKLFWPAAVSFDGSYLWVGEFKFSERTLRFSPQP